MSLLDAPRRLLARLGTALWVARVLVGSRMLTLVRPDKYLGMVRVLREQGAHATTSFALAAVRRPHGTAVVDERGSVTWRELQERSAALAAGLVAASGGRPPETVAVLCRNHRGLVESLVAATRLGSQVLLLNTGFSGPQLADVVEREGATVLVHDEEFTGLLEPVRARVPGLLEVLAWTDAPAAPGSTTVDGLVEHHRGQAPPRAARPGRVVLLTSGTTGTPKGARRGGGGADELAAVLDRVPWRAEETVVVAAPMFHAWGFGQLVVAATMTCTVVCRRRFEPEAVLDLVEQHRARGLSVVPVMLERIVDLPPEVLDRYRLDTLRFVSASGSRMRPDAVTAFMDRFGDVVHNSYNATEAGQITVAGPEDLRAAPDTAGRPVRGTTLLLVDDAGDPVPAGEVGRIAVRPASPFDGYTSGGTKEHLGDLMLTGDVGRLDADGRLTVVGRDDDMIVSGGENVYPLEVERALGDHHAVRETVVVGADDPDFGQRLVAYVVPAPGASAGEELATELRAHVKGQLAGFKVPRDVVFLDELPRNASGKVVRRDLPTVGAGPAVAP